MYCIPVLAFSIQAGHNDYIEVCHVHDLIPVEKLGHAGGNATHLFFSSQDTPFLEDVRDL